MQWYISVAYIYFHQLTANIACLFLSPSPAISIMYSSPPLAMGDRICFLGPISLKVLQSPALYIDTFLSPSLCLHNLGRIS